MKTAKNDTMELSAGKEELLEEIKRLKLDLKRYKSKCKEMAISFDTQMNSLNLVSISRNDQQLQKERTEKEQLKEELKAIKSSMQQSTSQTKSYTNENHANIKRESRIGNLKCVQDKDIIKWRLFHMPFLSYQ